MRNRIVHGETDGQGEHSMCGMAFDAYESGDSDEPIVFASVGEIITCLECRNVIDFYRGIRRYRQPGVPA